MNENYIKDEVQTALQALYGIHVKADEIGVEKPASKEYGDLSTNISFVLAGKVGKNPAQIAAEIASNIESLDVFEKVQAVGGFVNFYFSKEKYLSDLAEILEKGQNYAKSVEFKGKKVQVEFISANPTGPLTLANGRGGFGGDVLANIFAWAGAKVEREYYVNDGGNQVKILGESILVAAGKMDKKEDIYRGEYIEKWINENKSKINRPKENPFELGKLAASDILKNYIMPSVKKMGIKYDNWFSENEMIKNGDVEKVLKALKNSKLTYEKDGALWFETSKFGDDKDRVLVKSDGEKTYFANDVAYHWDKFKKRSYDKVVNIWGADHHGYVGRMLAATEAIGFPGCLEIIISQMVRLVKDGKEYKMSKRAGTYVTMEDLFGLIGGTQKEASDVARFFFLSRSFNTHMDFDLTLAREHSEKNPVFYVKYAHARLAGILKNSAGLKLPKPNLKLLEKPEELDLIEILSELKPTLSFILNSGDYPVHNLTFLAIEISKKLHYFYDKCKVIDEEDPELTAARLELVKAVKNVLFILGTNLIGIEMPERM